MMENKDDKIMELIKKIVYFSAFISLCFVGFNLYMFKISHNFIWLVFAIIWAISGLRDVASDDEDSYNEIKDKLDE